MTLTAEQSSQTPPSSGSATRAAPAHEESLLHFLARVSQRVFRWGVLIFLATTILAMFTVYPVAIIPFCLLILNLLLLMIAHVVEQKTYHPGDPHDETAEEQARAAPLLPPTPEVIEQEEVSSAVESRTAMIVAGILVFATFAALAIAAAMFGIELLLLGGFIIFAYILFVTTPVWLGWLNDEAEEVAHRVEEKLHGHDDQ